MMNKSIDDFFIPDNKVKLPEELDYTRAVEYIRTAEAFSRATYQSVYIIDYFKKKFLYVSPNSLFWGGLTPDEVCDLNYRFYLNYVPKEEQPLYLKSTKPGSYFSSQHLTKTAKTGISNMTFIF
ncbi:MAG: hypothetical protein HDS71_07725 [Bacteroidales bacterium]|nr:hypothetical protein [Bacteroidales bacterium]MBD5302967.1 hypothetical protein [Bacteroides sp.]